MSQLAYKFKGAGHDEPERKREYVEPDSRLSEAFEKWAATLVFNHEKDYERAVELLEGIDATVEEAHSLLIKYQDHKEIRQSGMFISAIYNKVPEKVIIYDLDVPVDFLAFKLNAKTFINNGTTKNNMGIYAQGNIINNGATYDQMGAYAKGNIINNGTTGAYLGVCAKGNIINNGTTDYAMGLEVKGNIINIGKAPVKKTTSIPELKQYLDNLKIQLTNPNMDEVLKVLETLTEEKLSKDITDILKRTNYAQ